MMCLDTVLLYYVAALVQIAGVKGIQALITLLKSSDKAFLTSETGRLCSVAGFSPLDSNRAEVVESRCICCLQQLALIQHIDYDTYLSYCGGCLLKFKHPPVTSKIWLVNPQVVKNILVGVEAAYNTNMVPIPTMEGMLRAPPCLTNGKQQLPSVSYKDIQELVHAVTHNELLVSFLHNGIEEKAPTLKTVLQKRLLKSIRAGTYTQLVPMCGSSQPVQCWLLRMVDSTRNWLRNSLPYSWGELTKWSSMLFIICFKIVLGQPVGSALHKDSANALTTAMAISDAEPSPVSWKVSKVTGVLVMSRV